MLLKNGVAGLTSSKTWLLKDCGSIETHNRTAVVVDLFLFSVAGLANQKKERAVFLSHWSLLTELSRCYTELGKVYLLQGAVREAKRFLKDGRKITRRFLSANRLVQDLMYSWGFI